MESTLGHFDNAEHPFLLGAPLEVSLVRLIGVHGEKCRIVLYDVAAFHAALNRFGRAWQHDNLGLRISHLLSSFHTETALADHRFEEPECRGPRHSVVGGLFIGFICSRGQKRGAIRNDIAVFLSALDGVHRRAQQHNVRLFVLHGLPPFVSVRFS